MRRRSAELLAAVRLAEDYTALTEAARIELLLRLLADPRPLRAPNIAYSQDLRDELAVFETARKLRREIGADSIRITSSAIPKASATCWK